MREPVKITLDRERTLRFDLNAMCLLEERGGLEPGKMATPSGLRFLLYAGLRHEDPDLTEEKVGALVDMDRLEEISEAVSRALSRHMPPAGQEQERPQQAQNRA